MKTETGNFHELLEAKWAEDKFVCMGLDPVYDKIPLSVPGRFEGDPTSLEEAIAYYNFCVMIVDATASTVAAYKPNAAFFEAAGGFGYLMLEQLIRHIRRVAPGVAIILDFKRADIGKTNVGSVRLAFDILGVDAVTVNPYFGEEALEPFLMREGKGVVVLVRTSNPGAGEFQNMLVDVPESLALEMGLLPDEWHRVPLYQWVAMRLSRWQSKGNVCVVVGATAPEETRETRLILPNATFLLPGVGTQKGKLSDAVLNGMNAAMQAFLVNSGSQELYASSAPDFAEATRAGVMLMDQNIRELLATAPKGV